MNEPVPLKYFPFADRQSPEDWRVEAGDKITGDCYIAIFCGPDAEYRANEYAAFKNGKHPAAKPISQPADLRAIERVTVQIQNGQEVTLALKNLVWKYDDKRKTICGRPKPAVEVLPSKG
jgi:hypothetical protein